MKLYFNKIPLCIILTLASCAKEEIHPEDYSLIDFAAKLEADHYKAIPGQSSPDMPADFHHQGNIHEN